METSFYFAFYWHTLAIIISPIQGDERMISSPNERKVNRLVHKYLVYVPGSDIVDLDDTELGTVTLLSQPPRARLTSILG